jgi:hypothetical protein
VRLRAAHSTTLAPGCDALRYPSRADFSSHRQTCGRESDCNGSGSDPSPRTPVPKTVVMTQVSRSTRRIVWLHGVCLLQRNARTRGAARAAHRQPEADLAGWRCWPVPTFSLIGFSGAGLCCSDSDVWMRQHRQLLARKWAFARTRSSRCGVLAEIGWLMGGWQDNPKWG